MTARSQAEWALTGVTVLWGSSFILVQNGIQDASTMAFLAVRFAVATVALLVLFRGRLKPDRLGARSGLIAGAFLAAAYVTQTEGLRFTTPAKSALLTSLCVPLVPLAGYLVYRNIPRPSEIAGIGLGFAGMAILTWPSEFGGVNRGDLLTAVCAVAFAGHITYLGAAAPGANFEMLTVTQQGVVSSVALLLAPLEGVRFEMGSPRLWIGLLTTAILCSALGYTVQAWAQQRTTAARTALIFTLEPVVAGATSWVLGVERFTAATWTGAALILAGLTIAQIGPALETAAMKRNGKSGHPLN